MALTDIPALASGYPQFSLADWPNSLAALVSGGLTAEFEKECWNAIISHLEQALTDAGLEWDSTYTTAEGAKITEAYGDLYANAFNSVRHNIDWPAPLGWIWDNNSGFRGYVGRENFRGVEQYGEKGADDVYAEYIPELIRKLNLLIGIMTGEQAALIVGKALSKTLYSGGIIARESLPLTGSGISKSLYRAGGVDVLPAAPVVGEGRSDSLYRADVDALKASVVVPEKTLMHTQHKAEAHALKAAVAVPEKTLVKSLYRFEWDLMNAIYVQGQGQSKSLHFFGPVALPVLAVEGKELAASSSKAEATAGTAAPTRAAELSQTVSSAELTLGIPAPVVGSGVSRSVAKCTVDQLFMAKAEGRGMSRSLCRAVLDTAWYPPVWVDGGLWIRQSHSVTQNDNGELVIM